MVVGALALCVLAHILTSVFVYVAKLLPPQVADSLGHSLLVRPHMRDCCCIGAEFKLGTFLTYNRDEYV